MRTYVMQEINTSIITNLKRPHYNTILFFKYFMRIFNIDKHLSFYKNITIKRQSLYKLLTID